MLAPVQAAQRSKPACLVTPRSECMGGFDAVSYYKSIYDALLFSVETQQTIGEAPCAQTRTLHPIYGLPQAHTPSQRLLAPMCSSGLRMWVRLH